MFAAKGSTDDADEQEVADAYAALLTALRSLEKERDAHESERIRLDDRLTDVLLENHRVDAELEAAKQVVEAAKIVNRAWWAYPLQAREYLPVFERERMPLLAAALTPRPGNTEGQE